MKRLLFFLLAGFSIPLISVSFGQAPPQHQRPPDGGTREVLVSILIPSVPNAPFSASVSTESIRQLPDGGRITLVNHRAIARDSAGRIFQERRLLVPEDGKHESVVTQTEISDPVAHALYICKPDEKVCQLEFYSAPIFTEPGASNLTEKKGPGESGEAVHRRFGNRRDSGDDSRRSGSNR